MNISPQPVAVPFHGDTILCIPGDTADDIRIVLKPTCESLGLEYTGQLQRLKRMPWAKLGIIPIPSAGGVQQAATMDRKTFGMWLVTIDPTRLKDKEISDKITLYQCEAAEVLDRHFFNPPATSEFQPVAPSLVQTIEAMLEQAKRYEAHQAALESQERRIEAIEVTLSGDTRYVSVIGYCSLNGIRLVNGEHAKVGAALAKQCRLAGIEVKHAPSELWGKVNIYPTEILDEWAAKRKAVME